METKEMKIHDLLQGQMYESFELAFWMAYSTKECKYLSSFYKKHIMKESRLLYWDMMYKIANLFALCGIELNSENFNNRDTFVTKFSKSGRIPCVAYTVHRIRYIHQRLNNKNTITEQAFQDYKYSLKNALSDDLPF